MKVLSVDIQGFNITSNNNTKFFAKEMAITNGHQANHYLFEMPIKYYSLSTYDKKQVNHATHQVHGLLFAKGYVNYEKIDDIIKEQMCDADIVYVRGHQKKDFLDEKISKIDDDGQRCPKIINLETLDATWTSSMTKFSRDIPKCMSHLTDKNYMCSLRNCFVIHNWISDCMPI